MKKIFRTSLSLLAVFGLLSGAHAQENEQGDQQGQQQQQQQAEEPELDLDELLQRVREGRVSETEEHRQREAEFRAKRDQQEQLLEEARQEREQLDQTATQLERTIQENDQRIAELNQTLDERLGQLKEMFGVIQQTAGDTRGQVRSSIISVQYDREQRLADLQNLIDKASKTSTLPSIEEIEVVWEELMLQMRASSQVAKFEHPIVTANGDKQTVELVRVGTFNLVSNNGGTYYDYLAENGNVVELPKQPAGRFTSSAERLANAAPEDTVRFGIDPTRGQLLGLLVQEPSLKERIDQGAEIGYVIIALGILGVLVAIYKMIELSITSAKVRKQMKDSGNPSDKNPLGRVLKAYEANKSVDVETLELKLDEAILRETPKLERGLTLIKIISAVAPLMGLLGTVTGMILTFQAITLFGTGDPKMMANGISQALITTALGLTVAIPTLLLHALVAGMSKRVIHVLEEQSAGVVSVHAEKEKERAGTA